MRYDPPPSGKRMVYWPLSLVVRERVTPVSTDIASTRAPSTGFPSGDVILPVMISVVLPTCARAAPGNTDAVTSSAMSANGAENTRRRDRCISGVDEVDHGQDLALREIQFDVTNRLSLAGMARRASQDERAE